MLFRSIIQNILTTFHADVTAAEAVIRCERPLPVITGHASQVESLFANLIKNALLYRDKRRKAEILIGCQKRSGHFEFYVRENGIGIEPKYPDKIFEMFRRLQNDPECPGTGIGLAYCKKVVEISGGRIWATSVPGQGSTFYFTYPMRTDSQDPAVHLPA